MYLVVLDNEMSAPSVRGFWKYGEANVLSTTRAAPALWAASAIVWMSRILSSGLVGDSIHTSCGDLFLILSKLAGSVRSQYSILTPNLANTSS